MHTMKCIAELLQSLVEMYKTVLWHDCLYRCTRPFLNILISVSVSHIYLFCHDILAVSLSIINELCNFPPQLIHSNLYAK